MARRSKTELMQARTKEYLELHAQYPEQYPADVQAVAAFVPCSRRLFYVDDPARAALLRDIEHARAQAQEKETTTLHLTPPTEPFGSLSDAELSTQVSDLTRRAVWTMERFIGHHKRSAPADESPLALHDLTQCLKALHRVRDDLGARVDELLRRRRPPPSGTRT